MEKTTLAFKIKKEIADKTKKFCDGRGIKYSFFIEKALEEKLLEEELKEDILDFKRLRKDEESAIPLEEYLKFRHV